MGVFPLNYQQYYYMIHLQTCIKQLSGSVGAQHCHTPKCIELHCNTLRSLIRNCPPSKSYLLNGLTIWLVIYPILVGEIPHDPASPCPHTLAKLVNESKSWIIHGTSTRLQVVSTWVTNTESYFRLHHSKCNTHSVPQAYMAFIDIVHTYMHAYMHAYIHNNNNNNNNKWQY